MPDQRAGYIRRRKTPLSGSDGWGGCGSSISPHNSISMSREIAASGRQLELVLNGSSISSPIASRPKNA
jgi:hypothetical protein